MFASPATLFPVQAVGEGSASSPVGQNSTQEKSKNIKESHRTNDQPIKIIGDDDFIKKTEDALSKIKEKSPMSYAIVTNHISIIRSVEKRSGIDAKAKYPTFYVGLTTSNSPLNWYASTIVHDAYHVKLYRDYTKEHKGEPVPPEVYSGRKAEDACLSAQENFLREIKASVRYIQQMRDMRKIDYFSTHIDRIW